MKPHSIVCRATGIFLLLSFISSHLSFSQEKKFELRLIIANTASKKYVKQIDSLSLWNDIKGEEWIYDNLKTQDSVFKISDLELGKYRIVVYQKGLVIPFAEFSLCTFCKNTVRMTASSTTANKVFDRVWIGPYYDKGFKQLTTDFLSGITIEEKKILKKTENKLKIKCFITADRRLSDVIFDQADLPDVIKSLIRKGLDKCKGWMPGITDGQPFDDYIQLSIAKIVD